MGNDSSKPESKYLPNMNYDLIIVNELIEMKS